MSGRPLAVIGVPTSAGAFAPGQEQAPAALRRAGLLECLADAGLQVRDGGDAEVWRWRPDRLHPRAQNLRPVIEIVRDTARRVAEAADAGEKTLVLGGDCTVGIGTVSGHVQTAPGVGLVYFDSHADLNVPESARRSSGSRSRSYRSRRYAAIRARQPRMPWACCEADAIGCWCTSTST
jgi:arginase